jgi:hypothetical protein
LKDYFIKMNNKNIKRFVYFLILLGIILFRYLSIDPASKNKNKDQRLSLFEEMQSKTIIYTDHAVCRMQCRYISEEEINQAMLHGKVNESKSEPNDQPCSTYAIETETNDGQNIRVIFANCEDVVKVVTAIDLKQEHTCYCD